MNKKKLALTLVLLVVLTGCGTSPDNPTGPNTPGFWEAINKFFSLAMIYAGRIAGNNIIWGLVITTIIVRVAMIPLFRAQIKSSTEMAKIQPEIKKIQAKYKGKTDQDSKMRMSQEQQALYARHKINPLAGCLPSLIQLPLLFAFYGAIQNLMINTTKAGKTGLDLFGASDMSMNFLFFSDLANPNVILALIAAATTYYSTALSSMGNDQAAGSDMMKTMQYVMPVMIFVFGLTLPGALSLYWIVGNTIMIIQTLVFKREDIQRARTQKKINKK